MKNLIYVLIFSTISYSANCQDDSYSFPIKRNSDAWNKMENYQQRWDACQIPENLLTTMSTDGLITTYLNYPLLGDLLVFTTTQRGVENLKKHFNGITELLARPDAQNKLLKRYIELYSQDINSQWTAIDIGDFVVKVISIESLLTQSSVLDGTNSIPKKEVMKIVYDAYQKKMKDKNYHGTVGLSSTAWLMSRIMKVDGLQLSIENRENTILTKTLISEGIVISLDQVESVGADAKRYLQ